MSESERTTLTKCAACGGVGGLHAPNCQYASPAPEAVPVPSNPEARETERVAPWDADIVLWHVRLNRERVRSQTIEKLTGIERGRLFNGRHPRWHIVDDNEDGELKQYIERGINPFPHAKFLLRFSGHKFRDSEICDKAQKPGDWVALDRLERGEMWPFLQLGFDTDTLQGKEGRQLIELPSPIPARFLEHWPNMQIHLSRNVYDIHRSDVLEKMAALLLKEIEDNPLPPNFTKDDLYPLFVRVNKALFPDLWGNVSDTPPPHPPEDPTRYFIPLTKKMYMSREQQLMNLETEQRVAAVKADYPRLDEFPVSFQECQREMLAMLNDITEKHPVMDERKILHGDRLEAGVVEYFEHNLGNAQSALRRAVAADNQELAQMFDQSPELVEAILSLHHWQFYGPGAPELTQAQSRHEAEFKKQNIFFGSSRWSHVALKVPEFGKEVNPKIKEEVSEAYQRISFAIFKLPDFRREFDEHLAGLVEVMKEDGIEFDAQAAEMRRIIDENDYKTFTDKTFPGQWGGEFGMLDYFNSMVRKFYDERVYVPLKSFFARFKKATWGVLYKDPAYHEQSRQAGMIQVIKTGQEPDYREGVDANRFAYPIDVGWEYQYEPR